MVCRAIKSCVLIIMTKCCNVYKHEPNIGHNHSAVIQLLAEGTFRVKFSIQCRVPQLGMFRCLELFLLNISYFLHKIPDISPTNPNVASRKKIQ